MGEKYEKNSSQVALRWILQHGCIPLPASGNERHIGENMNVFDFALTDEEMEAIDRGAINGPRLRITPEFNLGFTDEFDFTYEECWPK
jgi:diketogulonate reductase-like aldo/keto reductase